MGEKLDSSKRNVVCLVSAHARSLVNFRGPLIREMINRGCEVHAVAPDLERGEFAVILESWGVLTHNIPMSRTGLSPREDISTLWCLFRLLRKMTPSKVIFYNIKPVVYGLVAAWGAGVPKRYAMITGLGYAFTGQASGKRRLVQEVAKRLYRASLSKAHLVFFQNPDDEGLFRELSLLKPAVRSVVVNGSGVDVHYFDQQPLPKGGFSFLMLARLLADKGVREYAQASYMIKEEFPSVEFRLAGDFDDNPDAISLEEVDKWVNDGVIEYLGRIPDVRPVLEGTTVYVLPSYREGTPRTVLEAMSVGRPTITTDAPGCRETVEDGVSGFLVPVGSVDALYKKMKFFISHPDAVEKMATSARARAVEKYDVHVVNGVVLDEMGIEDFRGEVA